MTMWLVKCTIMQQTRQSNHSFHSHRVTEHVNGMVMIHFIPLPIPLPRSFHSLVHSIAT
ncbi:hypothetical protein HanPI659440_Chr01g0004801 [Helianthus annuus]|nr:hypothetical protein HanPI659440_Chr01g0004801 [Helianthus annuus]